MADWTPMADAPKDGRWIVVIDKYLNASAVRWDKSISRMFPENGERGWVGKSGYSPSTRVECNVGWIDAPSSLSTPDALKGDAE